MSCSSLWTINKEYKGTNKVEFGNSWLFAPIIWDAMYVKYMDVPEDAHLLSACLFDRTPWNDLNEMINQSESQSDRVMWELVNLQIFAVKDIPFVCKCIDEFIGGHSELPDHIKARFVEVKTAIQNIDRENLHFVFKGSSCDDNVECWFEYWSDEADECEDLSLLDDRCKTAWFVKIQDDKIINWYTNKELKEQLEDPDEPDQGK